MRPYGGMYQVCENCGESEFVPGTVHDFGDGDYELEKYQGSPLQWTCCPSCGIEFNGDTDEAQLSWSLHEPDSRSRIQVVLDSQKDL